MKKRNVLASILKERENQLPKAQFDGNNQFQNATIGEKSYISFNAIVHNCEIGKYCSIGPNAVIGFGNHPLDELSTSPSIYYNEQIFTLDEIAQKQKADYQKVLIKNDVWIGANVFVKNGVTIENGAVIGAGAVVLQDVAAYEVVIGVPAKCIKKRFSDEVISLLLQLSWWDFEEEKLNEMKEIITKPNVENLSVLLKK